MADYIALTTLLSSLVKKENLASFNCFGDCNGRINIRIQLIGSDENIADLPRMALRRKSERQLKRNQRRASNWRDSIPSEPLTSHSKSKENIRLDPNSPESNTSPDVLDISIVDDQPSCQSLSPNLIVPTHNQKDSFACDLPESVNHSSPKHSSEGTEEKLISRDWSDATQARIDMINKYEDHKHSVELSNLRSQLISKAPVPRPRPKQTLDKCNDTWCAVSKVLISCKCGSNDEPCDFCKDSKYDKLCRQCKNAFYKQ